MTNYLKYFILIPIIMRIKAIFDPDTNVVKIKQIKLMDNWNPDEQIL